MKMPDKYTHVWPALIDMLNTHGLAGLMAFILGYLRIIYDERESRPGRQFIEAALGACITVVVGLTAEHFGMSGGWAYACAGATGVLGVNQVRVMAQRWAMGKINSDKSSDEKPKTEQADNGENGK
jgi:lambda family phage holin